MPDHPALILQAIIPVEAVPEHLRRAVTRCVGDWGYSWADVRFAATARASGRDRHPNDQEQWVFAINADALQLGDEIVSGGGRGTGLSVGQFAAGVLPATPYLAYVYERLGGRGGGPGQQRQVPPPSPTTVDTAPAAPDLLR